MYDRLNRWSDEQTNELERGVHYGLRRLPYGSELGTSSHNQTAFLVTTQWHSLSHSSAPLFRAISLVAGQCLYTP